MVSQSDNLAAFGVCNIKGRLKHIVLIKIKILWLNFMFCSNNQFLKDMPILCCSFIARTLEVPQACTITKPHIYLYILPPMLFSQYCLCWHISGLYYISDWFLVTYFAGSCSLSKQPNHICCCFIEGCNEITGSVLCSQGPLLLTEFIWD